MLTYFPVPYPGEWWYSVLCRYHVRSGYSKNQTTVGELFGGKVLAQMGTLFPNSTILRVYNQLPQDAFQIRNCIVNNTLFPYFTRFYTLHEKESMLLQIEQGKSIVTTSIRRFSDFQGWAPKYCPLCYQADRDRYGEAYWHVEHQISLAKICTEHRCRLVKSNIDPTHLSYAFFPLDAIKTVESPCADILDLEYELSSIFLSYQLLPLEYGVTIGYNNLAIALANMGYEVIQKYSEHTILDAQRLYRDIITICHHDSCHITAREWGLGIVRQRVIVHIVCSFLSLIYYYMQSYKKLFCKIANEIHFFALFLPSLKASIILYAHSLKIICTYLLKEYNSSALSNVHILLYARYEKTITIFKNFFFV